MNKGFGKYLFYTVALSALLAPFAMQADGVEPQLQPVGVSAENRGEARAPLWKRRMAARRSVARRALHRLDENGDGKIDLNEFHGREGNRLTQMDTDGNGAVSLEELKSFREQRANAQIEQRFAQLDSDGDGQITAEEVRVQRFGTIDRDGDGFISSRELVRARPPRPAQMDSQQE